MKRNVEKLFLTIATVAFVLVLTACGGSGDAKKQPADSEISEQKEVEVVKGMWVGTKEGIVVKIKLNPYEESLIDDSGMDERMTNAIIYLSEEGKEYPSTCASHSIEIDGDEVTMLVMDLSGNLVSVKCKYQSDGNLLFMPQELTYMTTSLENMILRPIVK